MRFAVCGLLFSCFTSAVVCAQTQPAQSPPDPYSRGLGTDCAYTNFFIGPSASAGGSAARLTGTSGVTIGQYFARTMGSGMVASPQFELGLAGPLPGGHAVDGLFSKNAMFANRIPRRAMYPSLTGGYTRMFATGNAVNFGIGFDFGENEYKRLVRIELRDYYLFTGPRQHVVGLRIGLGKFIAD